MALGPIHNRDGEQRGPPGPWQEWLAPGPVVELHGNPPLSDIAEAEGEFPEESLQIT